MAKFFKKNNKATLRIFVFSLLISLSSLVHTADTANAELEKLNNYNAQFLNKTTLEKLADASKSILFWYRSIETFCHEMGHALARKILVNHPVNIHFGAYPDEVPISSLKPGITLHSLNIARGGFNFHTEENITKIKDIIFLLAGPFATLLSLSVMRKLIEKYCTNNKINYVAAIYRSLMTFEIIYRARGFTPMSPPDGDGYRIWEYFLPQKLLHVCSNEYLLEFNMAMSILLSAHLDKSYIKKLFKIENRYYYACSFCIFSFILHINEKIQK